MTCKGIKMLSKNSKLYLILPFMMLMLFDDKLKYKVVYKINKKIYMEQSDIQPFWWSKIVNFLYWIDYIKTSSKVIKTVNIRCNKSSKKMVKITHVLVTFH